MSRKLGRGYKQLIKAAEKEGWTLKQTKKGYTMLHPNGKDTVGFHGTPSDHRALMNARGDFRRAGVKV